MLTLEPTVLDTVETVVVVVIEPEVALPPVRRFEKVFVDPVDVAAIVASAGAGLDVDAANAPIPPPPPAPAPPPPPPPPPAAPPPVAAV